MEDRKLLGEVLIQSVNQIGEAVKYDFKSNSFVIARRGSVFKLYAHGYSPDDLLDFRSLNAISITLETAGKMMAFDPESRRAFGIPVAVDPPEISIFNFVRQKFRNSYASISFKQDGIEFWLRHSNSRMRVCLFVLIEIFLSLIQKVQDPLLTSMPLSYSELRVQ